MIMPRKPQRNRTFVNSASGVFFKNRTVPVSFQLANVHFVQGWDEELYLLMYTIEIERKREDWLGSAFCLQGELHRGHVVIVVIQSMWFGYIGRLSQFGKEGFFYLPMVVTTYLAATAGGWERQPPVKLWCMPTAWAERITFAVLYINCTYIRQCTVYV